VQDVIFEGLQCELKGKRGPPLRHRTTIYNRISRGDFFLDFFVRHAIRSKCT
jgi:hypothetical protein